MARHDRCAFLWLFSVLFFSLAGTGPVRKVYVPDPARIAISLRESQTADMYRFFGHYDRPYAVIPGVCLTSHVYRYFHGTFSANH